MFPWWWCDDFSMRDTYAYALPMQPEEWWKILSKFSEVIHFHGFRSHATFTWKATVVGVTASAWIATNQKQHHEHIAEESYRMNLAAWCGHFGCDSIINSSHTRTLYTEHFLFLFYKQFTSKCVLPIITQYTVSSSRELSLVTGSLLSVWIISWECVTGWPKVLPAPLLALLRALYSACLICSTCGCFLVPSSAEIKVDTGRHLEPECFAHTC